MFNSVRNSISSIFLLLFLSSCATDDYLTLEPVGGITGTGNSIDCDLEENKTHESCVKK